MSPVSFRSIDVAGVQFADVVTVDGKVSVPLQAPLMVLTGPSVICTDPVDPKTYEVNPFLTVKPLSSACKSFFEAFETRVLQVALENAQTWFNGADAGVVETSLKKFVKNGSVKLRLPSDVDAFDEAGTRCDIAEFAPGDTVRAIVETSAARLGKQEFGIIWTVVQVRKMPKAVCLITGDGEDDEAEEWDAFV